MSLFHEILKTSNRLSEKRKSTPKYGSSDANKEINNSNNYSQSSIIVSQNTMYSNKMDPIIKTSARISVKEVDLRATESKNEGIKAISKRKFRNLQLNRKNFR